jgi:hypothetical protein
LASANEIERPRLLASAPGTFLCAQVPPNVVRTSDGIRIVFAGDDASRFAGKIVDRENGSLIIRDR